MEFIQAVRVKDFRSLAKVGLEGIGDLAPVVGPNGSGKSNVFRALNLFFNGVVEDNDPLDLRRDFREPERQQKFLISVEVDLDLGSNLRDALQSALDQLVGGSSKFTVRKIYSLDPNTGMPAVEYGVAPLGTAPTAAKADDVALIERLLSTVRFRYVPNHQHPSMILQHEEDNIRRMLFSRVGRGKSFDESQLELIREKAKNLMAPVEESMQQATGAIDQVELGTPGGWKDLVWAFGLKMRAGQTESFEAILHGSGIQSVLAYSVLALVDTSFGGSFGWRRGTVWAIEEPESFLHAKLQAALAQRLMDYASGERLQILLTTHSPAFLGVTDHGFSISMNESGRSEVARLDRQTLIREAQSAGVAPFSHPLHTGPPKPILLVEGKNDRELLQHAYLISPEPCPYEILAIEDLEEDLQGGVDQIRSYLHHNQAALRARPKESPVVVLIDWEESAKNEAKIHKELLEHPTSLCTRMPESARNSDLSRDFVGIEGFLSTGFYEAAASSLGLPLTQPVPGSSASHKFAIKREELREAKGRLHKLLLDRDNDEDIQPLVDLLPWINEHVTAGQLSLTP